MFVERAQRDLGLALGAFCGFWLHAPRAIRLYRRVSRRNACWDIFDTSAYELDW